MKIFKLLIVLLLIAYQGIAESVDLTGSSAVCPGETVTYTASGSNAFGSVGGCFYWSVYEDGQWTVQNLANCDCGGSSSPSTSTFDYNWDTNLGSGKVKVVFVPHYSTELLCITATDELNITKRMINPGQPTNTTFCSSGQTKTITIPGIPTGTCNWHHKYDWLVPSGWSVVPADNTGYQNISGGIRTAATSVEITAPNSSLDPGYSGNYEVKVKSEPAWPYPVESSAQIWVGSPSSPTIYGPSQLCPDHCDIYTAESSGATSYNWVHPYFNCNFNCNSDEYAIGLCLDTDASYGQIMVRGENQCGNSGYSYKSIYASGCGGGYYSVYPNPSENYIEIQLAKNIDQKSYGQVSSKGLDFDIDDNIPLKVTIYSEEMIPVLEEEIDDNGDRINVADIPKGKYILHINDGKDIIKKHILIE